MGLDPRRESSPPVLPARSFGRRSGPTVGQTSEQRLPQEVTNPVVFGVRRYRAESDAAPDCTGLAGFGEPGVAPCVCPTAAGAALSG
jgi:hypothetical protein